MAGGISVDKDFARFGSKSYAINKINTVEVRERQPYGLGSAVICGLIGLAAVGIGRGQMNTHNGSPAGMIVVGVMFLGLTVWLWKRSTIVEYQLFLMTSSSEAQAYTSRDQDEVLSLRDSIEAAMVGAD